MCFTEAPITPQPTTTAAAPTAVLFLHVLVVPAVLYSQRNNPSTIFDGRIIGGIYLYGAHQTILPFE